MSNMKKNAKSKFLSEDINDFMTESQYIKQSPKPKKSLKRANVEPIEEEEMAKSNGDYHAVGKQTKAATALDGASSTRQKVLDTMSRQLESRKQSNDAVLRKFSEVLNELDADISVLKENEQKLENLTGALLKCFQQASAAHKQKLKSLWGIHNAIKQEVEGLITRGGIKPDDRPLWFDVYKACPPIAEPKFAKPQPEIKPIRQILYREDVIRAKFHSEGRGLGIVNMLNPTGESHIKKLVKQYEKLKSEGVPESELVEKSTAAVDSQRQTDLAPEKPVAKNPNSVTSQVLAEADLKNIFSEN